MKSIYKYMVLLVAVVGILCGCTKVPPGYVGIKVNQYGQQKGVEDFPLQTGMVWYNPFTTDVEKFPTFMQTVIWTKTPHEGNPQDESISFNSVEGAAINADVSCALKIDGAKVPHIYIEFRQHPEVLMDTYIHNQVRDVLNRTSSSMKAMDILGTQKSQLLDIVKKELNVRLNSRGFTFDLVAFSGDLRVDARVTESINAVIQQTQDAIKAQQKIVQATAEADQKIATSLGEQKSKINVATGESQAILIKATAQANANTLIAESLAKNPLVLQSIALEKWDGKLPYVNGGGALPFINVAGVSTNR